MFIKCITIHFKSIKIKNSLIYPHYSSMPKFGCNLVSMIHFISNIYLFIYFVSLFSTNSFYMSECDHWKDNIDMTVKELENILI